ncbi:MAG: formaldehyde dehydrogenase, glutathione-independent, partial [Trinickia sp.]
LFDRLPIAKIVNVSVFSLDDAPEGYMQFDGGAGRKFVIDPHGLLKAA